jgi:hypothetical protein
MLWIAIEFLITVDVFTSVIAESALVFTLCQTFNRFTCGAAALSVDRDDSLRKAVSVTARLLANPVGASKAAVFLETGAVESLASLAADSCAPELLPAVLSLLDRLVCSSGAVAMATLKFTSFVEKLRQTLNDCLEHSVVRWKDELIPALGLLTNMSRFDRTYSLVTPDLLQLLVVRVSSLSKGDPSDQLALRMFSVLCAIEASLSSLNSSDITVTDTSFRDVVQTTANMCANADDLAVVDKALSILLSLCPYRQARIYISSETTVDQLLQCMHRFAPSSSPLAAARYASFTEQMETEAKLFALACHKNLRLIDIVLLSSNENKIDPARNRQDLVKTLCDILSKAPKYV